MTRLSLALLMLATPSLVQGQAEPRRFQLHTSDGVALAAYEYAPPDGGARPYVLLFHQAGSNALGEYGPIAPRLLDAGFNLLAIDQRSGGTRFGADNATVEALGATTDDYCAGLPDLEAALDYARERAPERPAVLWGSSYSAALVVHLAAARPRDVAGVLAFSPATGDPMEGCKPESAAARLEVPLIAFRPEREAAIPSVAQQLQTLRAQGHEVHVLHPGTHGSSTLVAERVEGDVSPAWTLVMDFLGRVRGR